MKASKVVGQTKTPRTPAELYALGARLDRELSVTDHSCANAVSFLKCAVGMNWGIGNRSDSLRNSASAINERTGSVVGVCSLPNNPGTKYLPIALAEPTGIPALANFLPT